MNPGPGYGGSCFPKDTLAPARIAQEFEASRTVESVIEVNASQKLEWLLKLEMQLVEVRMTKK